jgi:hypothetical protein
VLTRFDWLRRSRTGPELLATLRYLEETPELPTDDIDPGPPPTALTGPCQRCWVYPRATGRYCATCQAILDRAWPLRGVVPRSVVIWGFVNRLPRSRGSVGDRLERSGGDRLERSGGDRPERNRASGAPLGLYVQDDHHFLLMLSHDSLKPWLQELVLYHGAELKGLLQIFPTTGGRSAPMGDLLARMIHQETRYPPDRLRVRFFSSLEQIFHPRAYDKEGVLTFEVSEFLNTLELATVFRTVLRPDEQKTLYKLLHTADSAQAQFYWGRFLGTLSQEARDMLTAWGIRSWSEYQITLLYELADYVAFTYGELSRASPA